MGMQEELKNAIGTAVKSLFDVDLKPELTRPEERFGDYSTNVALELAVRLSDNPKNIADKLADKLTSIPGIEKAEVAGPGFINFTLTSEKLAEGAASALDLPQNYQGQEIVAEYSDPNPFKVLHVGHLYTSIVGDAIAKILETAGAKVHRVNFGGDVGRHVAITMWSILRELGGENPDKLADIPAERRAKWLAEMYVAGNKAFGAGGEMDDEVKELNKKIYQIHEQSDHSSNLAKIYWTTRKWSYEYFDEFYARIGTHFDKYYPESETVEPGVKSVKENLGKVFEESDGAIVFKGEVHNMHTRVFINSQGLPTYETKDIGLLMKKWGDYHFDKSVVITGNEIYEYMQVVLKAAEQFAPELVQKTTHITHGMVKLTGGTKMSSRAGNIIGAEDVLDAANEANKKANHQENFEVALGAVKYAFLKNRIGADIIFDTEESVNLEGNSRPYLQYAHARACSILAKSDKQPKQGNDFDAAERSLARKLSEYPEVVLRASTELMPHHIAGYLYELAQIFNRFYESSRIINDPRESLRLNLVKIYRQVLENGLNLLGIKAPEKI